MIEFLTMFLVDGSIPKTHTVMPQLSIHMLPMFVAEVDLSGSTSVMIDVLRASSTITHALVHGAAKVIPTQEVVEAQEIAQQLPAGTFLLGGERGGELIEGFDLDNSPLKYTQEVVSGKSVIFTTTNGTKALHTCQAAEEVLIGAFVNLSAIVNYAQQSSRDLHLVCAGTNGQFTAEDLLFAGAVTDQLLRQNETPWNLVGVQTQMTLDFYRTHAKDADSFRTAFHAALGAQNLIKLGMHDDIVRCMQRDLFNVVAKWNSTKNEIVR